jgi:imidazoleglycerol-phosphate dehydratase
MAAAVSGASPSSVVSSGNGALTTTGRLATVKRKTKETEVEVTINLDGTGICVAETPVGFLNHMLDQVRPSTRQVQSDK